MGRERTGGSRDRMAREARENARGTWLIFVSATTAHEKSNRHGYFFPSAFAINSDLPLAKTCCRRQFSEKHPIVNSF